MKRINTVCVISVIGLILYSHSKETIDARNAFVGTYSETIEIICKQDSDKDLHFICF